MPHPGLLHPESLHRPLLTHTSTGDTQTQFWLSLHGLGLRCVPFLGLSSSGGRVLGSTLSQEGHGLTHLPDELLSLPGALRECCLGCALCLLSGADLRLQPSWQMSTLQDTRETWLAAGSLLAVWWRMPSLGLRLPLAFRLWLSPACLSASWQAGAGPQPASSPLGFAQSFVL